MASILTSITRQDFLLYAGVPNAFTTTILDVDENPVDLSQYAGTFVVHADAGPSVPYVTLVTGTSGLVFNVATGEATWRFEEADVDAIPVRRAPCYLELTKRSGGWGLIMLKGAVRKPRT